MNNKTIIITSRILSIIFTPFYLPMVGLLLLFFFSYLRLLPVTYIAHVLFITYLFTILLPTVMIFFYRHYHGWKPFELGVKEKRVVPYAVSILCYLVCYHLMQMWHMPHFITGIIIAALAVQVACALLNIVWKVSTHSAAIGGVTGSIVAYSVIFGFNPTWWLCLTILIAGLLGTARMILRQHTLSQVLMGYIIGTVCAALSILYVNI